MTGSKQKRPRKSKNGRGKAKTAREKQKRPWKTSTVCKCNQQVNIPHLPISVLYLISKEDVNVNLIVNYVFKTLQKSWKGRADFIFSSLFNEKCSFFSKERGTERVPGIWGTAKALNLTCWRKLALFCLPWPILSMSRYYPPYQEYQSTIFRSQLPIGQRNLICIVVWHLLRSKK